ncbi:MAG: hypothetical protein IGR76_09895 [Synechococcales cyanobacterium T60_A2020_003]|nr:hypothetical protein [Synechococcales cyanobacterium T60_A2020_003]
MSTATETIIALGPINVTLSNLRIQDTAIPAQAENVIKAGDAFDLSVDVAFSPCPNPFTNFLLGLGLTIEVLYHIEGFGTATEVDLGPAITTTNGTDCAYTATLNSPGAALGVGVYKAIAVVTVKGAGIPFAVGFISDVVFQVY